MGASRFVSSRSDIYLQAGDGHPALASFLPRHLAAPPLVQAAYRPPWSMGVRKGEPTSPSGRRRCRNTGRGPGRESPGRGLQGGATTPLLDGSRESEVSLRRDATAITLPQPGRARCPSALAAG